MSVGITRLQSIQIANLALALFAICSCSWLSCGQAFATGGRDSAASTQSLDFAANLLHNSNQRRIVMKGLRMATSSTSSTSAKAGTASASQQSLRPRVAIIGAGAAGLAAAKVFKHSADQKYNVTVFEKDNTIGGVWCYTPKAKDRPMYQGLRTNLPKEIMAFREFPWTISGNEDDSQDDKKKKSFISHRQVRNYLNDYASHFELSDCIQLGTTVKQLTVLPPASEEQTNRFSPQWPTIRLDVIKDCKGQSTDSQTFDAVCVCNGHYSLPVIPDLPGFQEGYYKGKIIHSMEYDNPKDFANQTVLCVGGRASGSDVAREIAQQGGKTHVFLSDTAFVNKEDETNGTPISKYNVTWVPKTLAILPDGRVQFDNDCPISPKVDTIIFCTGYDYHFPFINEKSNVPLDASCRRVTPLYEQLWHAQYPNIAFVGLPHSILPFPFFEFQLQASERLWRRHGKDFPSPPQLLEAARKDAESGGEGKENGRVPEDTHYLGSAQWNYCRKMAKYADIYDDQIEDYLATNKVRP